MSQRSTPDRSDKKRQRVQPATSSPRKHARETTNEKQKILKEIERVEREIEKLRQYKGEHNSRREVFADVLEDPEQLGDDSGDTEGLEELLREMDDGALAALLTQGISAASAETITPYFPEAKMLIPPPAKSAGIEGIGSGIEIDEEVKQLDATEGEPTDKITEAALQSRIDRGQELLRHLAQFAMIDFYKISSTAPASTNADPSKILRTITMTGRTLELGDIQVSFDVQEEITREAPADNPQIVNLTVDIEGEELYRALGDAHLRNIVNDRNLPAILLSIRTLVPLARTRLHLFQSIHAAFPDLCQEHMKRNKTLHTALSQLDDLSLSSNVLVDLAVMERLILQSDNGSKLEIYFQIRFNQWGHALPHISIQPHISPSLTLSKSARAVLDDLPWQFNRMCKHFVQPYHAGTALVTIIQAFFAIS